MTPGAALVARIVAEMAAHGLEPDGRELELLELAAGLADRLAALEDAILTEGLTSVSAGGVTHLHPAVAESRQTRTSLGRLLAGIQMADDTRDPVKQRAAQVRWRDHSKRAPRG